MEDIINRGGGNLIVTLHNRDGDRLADSPVQVTLDGICQTHAAGSQLRLSPGESVTLLPGVWHSFWGETGYGDVLVGEVSMPNDDEHDNVFLTRWRALIRLMRMKRRAGCCVTNITAGWHNRSVPWH